MTKTQEAQLPEMLRNVVHSARMEGHTISDSMQAMYLSVLRGERTLEECLHQLRQKNGAAR